MTIQAPQEPERNEDIRRFERQIGAIRRRIEHEGDRVRALLESIAAEVRSDAFPLLPEERDER